MAGVDEPNLTDMRVLQEILSASRVWQLQQKAIADWLAAVLVPAVVRIDEVASEVSELMVSAATGIVARLNEHLPANWPRDGQLNNTIKLLEEGIPLVFVPRLETVRTLLAADDYDGRMVLLRNHRRSIVEDCREALRVEKFHPAVAPQAPLVSDSVGLLDRGLFSGAQSLAVVVSDTLLQTLIPTSLKPRGRYPFMIETINNAHFDDEVLDLFFALRPVLSFLSPWWPGDDAKPKPSRLSRHLTVHGASPEHFSEENATLAVMLATGLLVGFSKGEYWIDANSPATA